MKQQKLFHWIWLVAFAQLLFVFPGAPFTVQGSMSFKF